MSEELRKGIIKGVTTGRVEFTEDEKEQHDKDFEKILRSAGVLKENESIKELKHP